MPLEYAEVFRTIFFALVELFLKAIFLRIMSLLVISVSIPYFVDIVYQP